MILPPARSTNFEKLELKGRHFDVNSGDFSGCDPREAALDELVEQNPKGEIVDLLAVYDPLLRKRMLHGVAGQLRSNPVSLRLIAQITQLGDPEIRQLDHELLRVEHHQVR